MNKLIFPLFIFLINFLLSFILSIHLSHQDAYTFFNLIITICLFSFFLINFIFRLIRKKKLLNITLLILMFIFFVYIIFKSEGILFYDFGFILDSLIFYNSSKSLIVLFLFCALIVYCYYSFLFIDIKFSKDSFLKRITTDLLHYKKMMKLIFSSILMLFYSLLIYRYLAYYDNRSIFQYNFENDYSIFSIDYRDVSKSYDNYTSDYDKLFPNSEYGKHKFEEFFHPIEIFNNTQSTAFLILMNFLYIVIISKYIQYESRLAQS